MPLEIRGPRPAVQASLSMMTWLLVCFLGAALLIVTIFAKLGASTAFLSESFFVLGGAVALVVAFLSQTLGSSAPKKADLSAPPIFRGLALCADALSVTFLMGLAGAVFVLGDDGLAFALGIGSGFLLTQLLIAPRLPKLNARSVTGIFSELYGGWAQRSLTVVIVTVSMTILLVAQLMAAGLIGARLLELPFENAVYISAGILAACFLLNSAAGTPWLNGVLYLLALVIFLLPLVAISTQQFGMALPQLAYADALQQVRGLEESLLENGLADPARLKPTFTPFLSFSPLSFAGVVLGLAAGMASLPNLLAGHNVIGPVKDARRGAVWGLIFAAIFLSAAPAYAAFAKLELYKMIQSGAQLSDLPAWVLTYGKLGLVEICGQPARDTAMVTAACAGIENPTTTLRLQDIVFRPDAIVLMFPEIAGFSHWVFGLLAAAGVALALVTADGPIRTIMSGLGVPMMAVPESGAQLSRSAKLLSYLVAIAVIAFAAWAATTRPADVMTTTAWAFTLAAAGLFPALFAGLWWSRAHTWGAAIAMVLGFGVCLYYIVATHFFAVSFAETWGFLSNAGLMGLETLKELKQTWMAAPIGPEKETAWLELQRHAREIANWWGLSNLAMSLIALPLGMAALVIVSLSIRESAPNTEPTTTGP